MSFPCRTTRWLWSLTAALAVVTACASDTSERSAGDAARPGGTDQSVEEPESTTDDADADPDPDPGESHGGQDAASVEPEAGFERPFEELDGVTTSSDYGYGSGIGLWQLRVPAVEDVRIPSTTGDHEQSALWLAPEGDSPRPLLVVLHSWSYGYLQHTGIPFARWARLQGFGMIHPDFGGRSNTPEAAGSDRAVQDILDAVDFAEEAADIDGDRVYVLGFSGGGQMSLLVAARHPGRFAGVVSFVPVHDLVDWYRHNRESGAARYRDHLEAVCDGDPTADADARDRCLDRSPRRHLGEVDTSLPVYIAHGLDDDVVPPTHAVRAFNQLARPRDALSDEALEAVARNGLPEDLRGEVEAETYFGDDDPAVEFSRRSGSTTLVLFAGGHDLVYHPGLRWIHELTG